MTTVVGFCGYAQVGKDTAAEALIAEGFHKVSFADSLRDLAYRLNPVIVELSNGHELRYADVVDLKGYEWTKANTNAREFLVRLGAGGREIIEPLVWVRSAMRRVSELTSACQNVVITDVRYLNEVLAIQQQGGRVIMIVRPEIGPVNSEEQRSMKEIQDAGAVDGWLLNNGTVGELHTRVKSLVRSRT